MLWAAGKIVEENFLAPALRKMSADHERYWPLAVRDMRTIAKATGSPAVSGPDAGEFFEPHVRWESGRLRGRHEVDGSLGLPQALIEQLRSAGDRWVALDPSITGGLDFTWMKKLGRYQSWDVWSRVFSVQEQPISPFDFALPDFVPFQHWAKLRLLRGSLAGDPASASVEVRHLASVLFSTSTLTGVAVSLALLKIEARFLESRHAANDAVALEVGRSFMAAGFGPNLLLEPAELDRALDDAAAGPFHCMSTAVVAWTALPIKNGLARRRRAQVEAIGRRLSQDAQGCRLQALQRAWNGEDGYQVADFIDAVESQPSRGIWRLLSYVPVVGSVVFEFAGVLMTPTGYRHYQTMAGVTEPGIRQDKREPSAGN